ncbi:glycosyl transferase, group 2 family protein [Synechococcus sp. PCC 7335]|uniref:glycosyltransferase family 2 protein n=1 Tax=Synechococcus sp. (strain ATCC 29403 / PCC 7335) TaxID=91464 RepID=UPI00017ED53D|nr:glycosyltransferase family A protein [Synechococcus sp. PCC 7335]EDX83900.1 glycosyl transferase, group 2 family protein [Synechococcus sp. PCC 7335]
MHKSVDKESLLSAEPLVSVIVPAYNAETFITRTLASISAQTYRNLEVWVVDDGSSDHTSAIVEALAQHDSRIQLLQQPNQGVANARNVGIRAANGVFIAPIDADDVWCQNTLEKLVDKFRLLAPQAGVVYTWSIDIDKQGQPTGGFHAARISGNVLKTLICHNFLGNASSTLIRKTYLDQVGGYSTELRNCEAQGCEDWDLYLRLAGQCEFEVVPEFLVGYRKIASSMSQDFNQMARSQQVMLASVQKKHPQIPKYLYRLSKSSFYLYLAQQCNQTGSFRKTLSWLRRAIKTDPLVLLRPGLYLLPFQSLIGRLDRNAQNRHTRKSTDIFSLSSSEVPLNRLFHAINSTKVHHPKVSLKLFVGSVLHRTLSKI